MFNSKNIDLVSSVAIPLEELTDFNNEILKGLNLTFTTSFNENKIIEEIKNRISIIELRDNIYDKVELIELSSKVDLIKINIEEKNEFKFRIGNLYSTLELLNILNEYEKNKLSSLEELNVFESKVRFLNATPLKSIIEKGILRLKSEVVLLDENKNISIEKKNDSMTLEELDNYLIKNKHLNYINLGSVGRNWVIKNYYKNRKFDEIKENDFILDIDFYIKELNNIILKINNSESLTEFKVNLNILDIISDQNEEINKYLFVNRKSYFSLLHILNDIKTFTLNYSNTIVYTLK